MALILKNRVKETSLTSGSGTLVLDGAVAGYQSFSGVMSSGDTTYYTIVNGDNWEVGVGTYTPNSLSRDSILSSSTGSKISLSGQSYVFIAYPSEKSVYKNTNDQIVVSSSGIRFNDGTVQTTAGGGGGGGSYTAGNGLELSGNEFSVDNTVVQSGDNISVLTNNAGYLTSHPSITAASSSNNSGRTYIQDVLLDSNGHVTGISTATETVVDTDTTYTAGTGLQLSGTIFSVDSSVLRSGQNVSLLSNDAGYLTSHPVISAASSSNNSGRTYIQDILLDGNGHITGIVTATETVTDTDTTYSAGSGLQLSGTTFSVDSTVARSGDNITIFANNAGYLTSHPAIVAASSVDNAPHYFIQDILLDGNGHVTGITTDAEYIHTTGDGLQRDGYEFSVDETVARTGMSLSVFDNSMTKYVASGSNISQFVNNVGYLTSHPTISAASSSDNSDRTYIQDIFLDSNGHVTGISTATESSTGIIYSAGSGISISGSSISTSGSGNFSSIILQSGTPVTTTNQLYNIGGVLYFNGSGLGGGGTTYSAGSGLTLSGTTFNTSGILSAISTISWSSGAEVPTLTGVNSASVLRVGTSANNLVQLTSAGKLPAVDGSLLTGLSSPTIICVSATERDYNGTNSSFVDVTGMPITITSTGLWSIDLQINGYLTAIGPTLTARLAVSSGSISGVTGHPAGIYWLQGASATQNAKITTGSPTVIDCGSKASGERAIVLSSKLSVNVTATGILTPQIAITSTGVPSMLMLGTSYIKATKL